MPRLTSNAVPSYRLHKQSGQAIVTLNRRDITLGKHGTRESRDRYNSLISEWLGAGRQLPQTSTVATVAEVVNAYRKHAVTYYRHADGTPTGEASRLVRELSPLVKLYARLPAAEFSPLKLKALRERMIQSGWVRTSVNHAIGTVKRVFKWATENELVSAQVHHGLSAVAGLKAGRSDAPESDEVKPVALEHITAVLPLVAPQVAAMIQLQLLTGMRSGEVCIMRTGDIDRSGSLWAYRPQRHKTQHHGHAREVYLGPKAQEIVLPFLRLDPGSFVFSPADAERDRREKSHAARKTPMSCGNRPGGDRKGIRRRPPGECYDVASYRRAIARACDDAFPPPASLSRASVKARHGGTRLETRCAWQSRLTPAQRRELSLWQARHRWHPHQLRHTAATELRKTHGLEAAQVILGHKTLSVTQLYAAKNVEAAQRIMAQVG